MKYILSFLYCGFVCGVSEYALEKTKLTPGHINTSLVIIGCMLSGFKIYDNILNTFYAGASIPIINFGHLLVTGASEYYDKFGFIGLFKGVLSYASSGISIAVLSAFMITMICKIKN